MHSTAAEAAGVSTATAAVTATERHRARRHGRCAQRYGRSECKYLRPHRKLSIFHIQPPMPANVSIANMVADGSASMTK
jgi:hypothetical protein